jgi:hypothetical protein
VEKRARTGFCSVRWGRVGVSKTGPSDIVGVFTCCWVWGTSVPPELMVRRRAWVAFVMVLMGGGGGGGEMIVPEAVRVCMKSVRSDMPGR